MAFWCRGPRGGGGGLERRSGSSGDGSWHPAGRPGGRGQGGRGGRGRRGRGVLFGEAGAADDLLLRIKQLPRDAPLDESVIQVCRACEGVAQSSMCGLPACLHARLRCGCCNVAWRRWQPLPVPAMHRCNSAWPCRGCKPLCTACMTGCLPWLFTEGLTCSQTPRLLLPPSGLHSPCCLGPDTLSSLPNTLAPDTLPFQQNTLGPDTLPLLPRLLPAPHPAGAALPGLPGAGPADQRPRQGAPAAPRRAGAYLPAGWGDPRLPELSRGVHAIAGAVQRPHPRPQPVHSRQACRTTR